jgi:acyl-CoA reductase-like NAD-dependent aldehyde dehydrogenase
MLHPSKHSVNYAAPLGGAYLYTLDPNTPFDGYKSSGLGRELGPEGLTAYLEYKSIPRRRR